MSLFGRSRRPIDYLLIDSNDSLERYSEERSGEKLIQRDEHYSSHRSRSRHLFLCLAAIAIASSFSCFAGVWYGRLHPSDAACGLEPLGPFERSRVDRSLHRATYNPFLPNTVYTVPEDQGDGFADSKWADAGAYASARFVPVRFGHLYGFDPQKHVIKFAKDLDWIEEDSYPATVRVMHDLHCLNMLRQGLWFNYDYYQRHDHVSWRQTQDKVTIMHVNHCLDALRQMVMCRADDSLTPYLTATGGDVADFAIERWCRNFESVREFALDPQLSTATPNQTKWLSDVLDFNATKTLALNWTAEEMWRGL